MELVLKTSQALLRDEGGQTTVEYLLLIAMSFLTAYFLVTGPVSKFTQLMLSTIRSSLANVVQNGEIASGQVFQPGQAGHPSDRKRFRPLHLQ